MSEPMTNLHRTPEWNRLKNAGFFQIEDRPGQISLFRASPYAKTLQTLTIIAIAAPAAMIILGMMLGGTWGAFGAAVPAIVVCASLLFAGVLPAQHRLRQYADGVIFTPERIYFTKAGQDFGSLPREGMQQIVPDQDGTNPNERHVRSHKFLSDVGYVWAFAGSTENEHLLMNNILMAAFNQPVNMDLV